MNYKTTALLLTLLSFSAQAGLVDKVKGIIFGSKKEPEINLPFIPTKTSISKKVSVIQRMKNDVKFEANDEKRYNYSFVKELYQMVHKKDPSQEYISKWMNVLAQNGSREGVYRALVLDSSYLALENYEYSLSSEAVDFTLEYMNRFLARDLAKETLEKANFYTVKRSVTETSLEILDVLINRPGDDVYDWYAVLSADMAKKFPRLWKNKMRANTSAVAHKQWSQSVPDQYIKSEVILKLNKILNSLQS